MSSIIQPLVEKFSINNNVGYKYRFTYEDEDGASTEVRFILEKKSGLPIYKEIYEEILRTLFLDPICINIHVEKDTHEFTCIFMHELFYITLESEHVTSKTPIFHETPDTKAVHVKIKISWRCGYAYYKLLLQHSFINILWEEYLNLLEECEE